LTFVVRQRAGQYNNDTNVTSRTLLSAVWVVLCASTLSNGKDGFCYAHSTHIFIIWHCTLSPFWCRFYSKCTYKTDKQPFKKRFAVVEQEKLKARFKSGRIWQLFWARLTF